MEYFYNFGKSCHFLLGAYTSTSFSSVFNDRPFKLSIVMAAVSLTLSKVTLQYMGDKGSRKSPSTIALDIVSRGWSTPGLRDEIYIQLCKQTTANEKA